MALNNLYPVHNDSGAPIILEFNGSASTSGIPVFSYTGKPLRIALGGAWFVGQGTNQMTATVEHGLGVAPSWVDAIPTLNSMSNGWFAQFDVNAVDDATNFYLAAYASSPGLFQASVNFYFNWIAVAQLS